MCVCVCIYIYIFYNINVVNLRPQINKAIILKPWQNIKFYSYTFTISFGLEHTFKAEQMSLYLCRMGHKKVDRVRIIA